MKTIQKIKHYLVSTVVSLLALFGIYILVSKKVTANKKNKTDKQIDDNNRDIANAQGHIDAINDQITDVTEDIKTRETVIEDLKQQAETVQPEEITDVADAKQNIINKTKRRGRRPNKNKKS